MSSKIQYRADKLEITDTVALTNDSMAMICANNPATQYLNPATLHEELGSCARDAVEAAGWTYAGDNTGQPTFTHSHSVSAKVPRLWP